jgi:hypothetical protein
MYFIFLPLFFGLMLALARLSRLTPLGLKSLWLHPYNVLGAFIFLTVLDFGFLLLDLSEGRRGVSGGFFVSDYESAQTALAYLVLWSSFSVAAIAIATTLAHGPRIRHRWLDRTDTLITFLIAGFATAAVAILVLQYSVSMGSWFYVASIRTQFFSQNPLHYIAWGLLTPAYIWYGSRRGISKTVVFAGLVCMMLQISFGARGDLIFVAVILAFWFSQKFPGLGAPALYVLLPVGGIGLTVMLYLYRFSEQYLSLDDYVKAHGGWVDILFRGADVALAEAYTAALSSKLVMRDWYESLVLLLTAPIPRSFFAWKPLGASTHFTMMEDPENWLLFRREIVIGGPANLYLEMGFLIGALITAFFAYAWARVIVSSDRRGTGSFYGPVSILCLYTFGRNDVYSLALFLWSLAGAWIVHTTVVKVRASSTQSLRLREGQSE